MEPCDTARRGAIPEGPYEVLLTDGALEDLKRIQKYRPDWRTILDAVFAHLDHLERDPRPRGAVPLRGDEYFRTKAGRYGVLYRVYDSEKSIRVGRIREGQRAYEEIHLILKSL